MISTEVAVFLFGFFFTATSWDGDGYTLHKKQASGRIKSESSRGIQVNSSLDVSEDTWKVFLVAGSSGWLLCQESKKISVRARWRAVTMTEDKDRKNDIWRGRREKQVYFLLLLFSRLLKLRFKSGLIFTFRGSWGNIFSVEKQAVALRDRLPLWGCQISMQLSALSSLNLCQSQKISK